MRVQTNSSSSLEEIGHRADRRRPERIGILRSDKQLRRSGASSELRAVNTVSTQLRWIDTSGRLSGCRTVTRQLTKGRGFSRGKPGIPPGEDSRRRLRLVSRGRQGRPHPRPQAQAHQGVHIGNRRQPHRAAYQATPRQAAGAVADAGRHRECASRHCGRQNGKAAAKAAAMVQQRARAGVASRTISTLHSLLEHAVRLSEIESNPAKGVRRLAGTPRERRLLGRNQSPRAA